MICPGIETMRKTLLDSLDDFERRGHDCAYVFPRGYRHERWSYGRVAGVTYQFARELQSRNIGKGDFVLLWSSNCAEWVAAFLGCAVCGAVAVPLDDQSSPDFARRIGVQVSTRLVLCSRERGRIFEDTTAANPGTNAVGIAIIDPVELVAAIAHRSSERFRPVQIEASDTLEIVFTSGTTSEPKGVVITHNNVIGNIAPIESEIRKYLKYEKLVHPIRFLNLLPLSHVFGQFLGIFLPPLLGGVVVFENTFNPTEVVATIRRERVSVLVAVPRMIESLKQRIERDLEDEGRDAEFAARYTASASQHFLRRWWTFRDLRRKFGWKFWAMICGGAALDPKTEEFWHRLGCVVIQGYGLTETTSLISLNHPFHTSSGSIGKVLPGREIKLADDGEILVRGSGVARGYWTESDRELQPVAQSQDEGWYRTGDLGEIDEQGNLFFQGRKKEVIVTPAGMNVFPEDLEAALRKQKDVRDCIVVGLERGGNADPCAVLILHEPAPKEPAFVAGIVGRANETLAEYQRMRNWFVWPEEDFPRSATLKPRRNLIRDAVEAGLRGGPVSDAASPLVELLTRVTGRPTRELSSESTLATGLGLSSLERVALVGALEDRYQIDLSETNLANAVTVGDLESLIRGEKGGRGIRNESPTIFHYPGWVLHWPVTWLRLAVHYLLMRSAVFLLARPHVSGAENLDNISGPLLVVSNHIADVDIGLIQYALPRRFGNNLTTATRGEDLEALRSPNPQRAWAVRIYNRLQWTLGVAFLNLFPLPQHAGFRKSFAYAGAAVDRGYSVLVFPEGRHTRDGNVAEFQSGAGLLANNLLIPILPVRIDGLFQLKMAGKKFAPRGKIHVRMGKPMKFAPETKPKEIAQALQEAVNGL
jgi:long-chain acyl-CoA synthetase